jgi:hypothetical protein
MSGCLKQEGSPEAENIEGIRLLSRNGIVLKIVTVTPQPAPINITPKSRTGRLEVVKRICRY